MSFSAAHSRTLWAATSVAAAAFAFTPPVVSQRRFPRGSTSIAGRDAVAGEVLVRFADGARAADRLTIEREIDADDSEAVAGREDEGRELRRIRSRSFDARTLLDFLRTRASVAYAEPNYIVRAATTPNDPRFPSLWGLVNNGQTVDGRAGVTGADIHAGKAWNVTTGSRRNVVAVIDSGVDYMHWDLQDNIWSAPASFTATIGGVAVKCAAGTHGFNTIARTCDPRDDLNHGTHVAGTIGAVGNNATGVSGINWKASIMPLKFLDATGTGTVADAISAIEFAIQAKRAFQATSGANVRVLSNSWVGGGYSQALLDEINKANASGMLFVAAAGNDGSNNSSVPAYPASYKAPNVLAVAATTNQDQLASFSNYGSSVHLAAPGVDIMSTTIGNKYQWMSGTSMAAPHVAGAAALILSKCALDTAGVRAAILNNVDQIGALTGWVKNGGRLNVDRAVRSCAASTQTAAVPSAPTGLTAISAPGAGQVTLTWNAVSGATSYNVKRSYTDGGPYTTKATGVTRPGFVYDGTTGRRYYFVVSAVNSAGESHDSAQVTGIGK